MKWTIKVVSEEAPGDATMEFEVLTVERQALATPATIGLSIVEGKAIMEGIQTCMVAQQVEVQNKAIPACPSCGKQFRIKGYYHSVLRSVYGKAPMRIKRIKGCPCQGAESRSYSTLFTNKYPVTPELKYLTAKMAALTPFGKTADFLAELLPSSSRVSTGTARNRTIKVGKRLQKSAELLVNQSTLASSSAAVVGFDGGYVRARHRHPERNFEIVVGKVLNQDDQAVRFAFVRRGNSEAATAVDRALRSCGVDENTNLTVLTDGDAGLRAIHQQIAPKAEHVLDWFHVAMRFQNLGQIAKGISELNDGLTRRHALEELERAKWRLWNGQRRRGLIGLIHLARWTKSRCFEEKYAVRKLGTALLETIRYLELNSDSTPNYGSRYRKGSRISTGFAESAVNEVVAKRMAKRQQMAWNRHTVQPFLEVRVRVLDDTLEDAFRHWHVGFRPKPTCCDLPVSA